MSFTAKLFSKAFLLADNAKNKGLATPDDIRRSDGIVYGPDQTWNVLDVYRPKAADGKLPVIIDVHGGGWVYGNKEIYQFYCMELAQYGFAVVNFTYRLAPEYIFPSGIEDLNRVVEFVLKNAEEYGFNTEKIFLVGDSAGAHMSAIYACICTNRVYAKQFSFAPPEGFVPTAMVLNCGVYNAKAMTESKDMLNKLLKNLIHDLFGRKPGREDLAFISPANHVTESFPPCFIMTSNGDFLKEQPPFLMSQMDRAGVPYKFRQYGTEKEKLGHVFHCDLRLDTAHECNKTEAEYLLSFCKE